MHTARNYQQAGINEIQSFWARGGLNALYVLPTGGGKSYVMARIAAEFGRPVCAIAHRSELVGQISLAMAREGVRHRIIGPTALARLCTLAHLEEFGRDYVQPTSAIAVAGVDTLVRMDASDPWFAQVGVWLQDECFPAGTPVDGRAIETIRVGDLVRAFNEQTGCIEPRVITATFKHPAPDTMVRIVSGGRTIVATLGHPFLTRRGWVEAKDLRHDDSLLHSGLTWAGLDYVTLLKRGDSGFPLDGFVYNLEVHGLHTYLANDVVVHNCHHVLKANKWGAAAAMFPNARGLGVTATPTRADGKGLGRDSDGLFDEMFVGPSMRELIRAEYLTEYRIFAPPSDLDLSPVGISASGEFSPPQLSIARKRSRLTGDVVQHYLRIAPGKLGVTFDVDVESAVATAAAFRAAGVPAEVISAKTPGPLRAEILRRFKRREVLQLVNVDLFGEGFDLPAISVISMARPTMSYALFVQQFGRGLRLMDGKDYGIIIDHVGNTLRHGLPDAPRTWSLDRRERRSRSMATDVVPTRTCLNAACMGVYERVLSACPYCGTVHVPAGRSAPEQVDGDLFELDAETLARMRGEIQAGEALPRFPEGAPPEVIGAIKKHHAARLHAQDRLRAALALWAGWQGSQGRELPESQRRFYWRYGIDVGSAQALKRAEAEALAERIELDLKTVNVVEMI